MIAPRSLLASAGRILDGARRDAANGLNMSACVGAQRAAAMATEAWLREEGQPIVSASVHENVCLSPESRGDVREAARLLDRYRIDEGPHGSAGEVAGSARESEEAVEAANRVLEFVAGRMSAAG
ncbi:MAG: HEPN domain-containing protein [Gemmatimonadota bacterium]